MARDDEFRKVAEDIGALARSLARDFRNAVDDAMRGGHGPGRAVRHGLRDMTDEARRGMRNNWAAPPRRRHGKPWAPPGWGHGYGGWGRPPWAPPPPPGAPPRRSGAPGGRSGGPPGPPDRSSSAADAAHPPEGAGGPPWAATPSWNRPGRRSRTLPPLRHRWDATTVVGTLAVLFGVAWLIGATGVLHVSIEAVVAIGLMVLGASLVVTGRTDWSLSRRSWPVWLGLGMLVVLIATSTTFGLGGTLNGITFGNRTVAVSTAQLPANTVHGGFGNLTVNVNGGSLANSQTVRIVSVAGNTTVNLPAVHSYGISINARVGGGQICVNGTSVASGFDPHYQRTISSTSGPMLTLNVHQTAGRILIGSSGCGHR